VLKTFDAPLSQDAFSVKGVSVNLDKKTPARLAALVTFPNWDRSLLYLFDSDGQLVYEEVLAEKCRSIASIPGQGASPDVILVGGDRKIWKYSIP
jgi:hypothetical protein